jgi:predicted ester cyclase
MSTEENKAILRDSYEAIFNQHRVDRADEFYAANYLDHGADPRQAPGLDGAKETWAAYIATVADLRATIEEMIAEGDKIAVAWTVRGTHRGELLDIPPTGKYFRLTGLAIYRLVAGKIAELVAGTTPMSSLPTSDFPGIRTNTSTARSRALLDEVRRLVPEIGQLDRPRLFDFEFAHGPDTRQVTAGADRTYPGVGQITVHIAVSSRGEWRLPCTGLTGGEPCTRIEKFPDGSTAYLRTYTVPATVGHAYDVTLVKPDGTGVSVSSAAYRPEGAEMPDAPLSLDRVLEIARQITVTP